MVSSEQNAQHEKDAEKVRGSIQDPLLRDFGMPTKSEVIAAGLDPEAWSRGQRDWYDGSIRGMDAEIGRLVERLRALGLDRDTLVVFTADHGEEFFEHGRSFHGQSVYSELQRLPLVFWWPGHVGAGRRLGDPVATIDIMPTILELAGLQSPAGVQGRSLASRLGAQAAGAPAAASRELPVFTEKAATRPGQGSPPPYETESYAIVEGGWKLIHNVKPAAAPPRSSSTTAGATRAMPPTSPRATPTSSRASTARSRAGARRCSPPSWRRTPSGRGDAAGGAAAAQEPRLRAVSAAARHALSSGRPT